MPQPEQRFEGWSHAITYFKHHYWRDGRTLCGRWAILPQQEFLLKEVKPEKPKQCQGCRKILEKESA